MTAEELNYRLIESAKVLDWTTAIVPEFTLAKFRGRSDETTVPLPAGTYGLRLGDYPTIVAPVVLGSVEEMQASLRRLHSQMVIARSYMRAEEVINAHLMLCATNPSPDADWRSVVDLAERDETVCRKIIWIPDTVAMEASYKDFLTRTFLAAPWREADESLNAPLDNNQGLAQRTLVARGLTNEVAQQWVSAVRRVKDDPDALVVELVSAREAAQ
ncbi:ABC-three component system middle component 1 [Mesorhizobium newzealandense]|uniref:ABC-three component system middle component 1 n=1 Tax=Mesorhizobium newzealandense TaxID=1300302 RepID=A0ABW4UCZ6_9HYPH